MFPFHRLKGELGIISILYIENYTILIEQSNLFFSLLLFLVLQILPACTCT